MFSKQKHSPSPQLKIGHKDEESLLLGWGGEGWGRGEVWRGGGGIGLITIQTLVARCGAAGAG